MLSNYGAGGESWESLDRKIKPVSPKENQPWWFSGRTNAEAEALMLGPPDVKSWLIEKDLDAGEYWRQKKTGSRGWDDQIPSLTWWMWIWVNCRRQWRTEEPGVLQSIGSQKVRHCLAMEQQQQIHQFPWHLYRALFQRILVPLTLSFYYLKNNVHD